MGALGRLRPALIVLSVVTAAACADVLGIKDLPLETDDAGSHDATTPEATNGEAASDDGTVDTGPSVEDSTVGDAPENAGRDAAEAAESSGPDAGDGGGETGACPHACGPHQTCTITDGGGACTCTSTICAASGTACQNDQTLVTCTTDGDGCLYVASSSTCQAPQSCSGTAPGAACSLTCASSCSSGQTTCISGASGGLATCTLGANGCWAYGPPVACAGAHQSCTGTPGSAACTCKTDPVCTSTAATCASSSALATCAQDPQGCFYEASSSSCGASTTCSGGGCTGVCGPGQSTCSGNTPESCGPTGQWQAGTTCNGTAPVCVGGSCSAPPPSCQSTGAGISSCGASSENCCTSLEVPGSTYYRTYTNSGSGPTGEADPATVSNVRLDKYLVTVGRFRQFVAAWNGGSGWTPAAGSGKHTHLHAGKGLANSGNSGSYETGWVASDKSNIAPTNANLTSCSPSPWTNTAGSQENLPIACVNWYEAYAFCIWDGGFLPSEAEWENAAAGGTQQREYPWGSTAPGTACPGTGCSYAIYGCYYPNGSGTCSGVSGFAPVGTATAGAGLWGHLDLAGDAFEWNLDWSATYVDPCSDCAYLTTATYRVGRGGDFAHDATNLPAATRNLGPPTDRLNGCGLRCARTP
ncbi:MAG TPA: SUMF1/EgtB/PvdO family nonheme iron enzyme [Polyangiaceae bacterium]|nr:SUMF1/EgtB/PvdO family nonheme iron enzyme [Polyangiaceae bacterium]